MNGLKFILLCYVFIAPLSIQDKVPKSVVDKEPSFDEFLKLFPTAELPFNIDLGDLDMEQQANKEKSTSTEKKSKDKPRYKRRSMTKETAIMSHFLRDVEMASFSRMGPLPHEAVAQIDLGAGKVGVVFKRVSIYPYYFFSVLSASGEELSSKKVAYYNRSKSMTCSLGKDKVLEIKNYKNEWLKEINKKGVNDNEIIGYDLLSTSYYKIAAEGKIEQLKSYKTTDRASIN